VRAVVGRPTAILVTIADALGNPAQAASAHIAAPSNGLSLPQATIHLDDASEFDPHGGKAVIAGSVVAYGGTTSDTLTLCTGGSGVLSSGEEVDAAVLIDIVDGSGTAVVTGALATDDTPNGQYSYVLAPQADLDNLSVLWHATVGGYTQTIADTVRLIGNRILTPGDLAADDQLRVLAPNVRAYVLEVVEDLFADALGFPPVLEGVRVNFDAHRGTFSEAYAYGNVQQSILSAIPGLGFGFGGERLIVPGVALPQQVFALAINGNTADDTVIAQFQAGPGFLIWSGGRSWPSGNYEMWLSHGMTYLPADLRGAAAAYARYVAKKTPVGGGQQGLAIPERTVQLQTEGGLFMLGMASPDRPTGIADIDAVLNRYRTASIIG
jgi:hypothetical protein